MPSEAAGYAVSSGTGVGETLCHEFSLATRRLPEAGLEIQTRRGACKCAGE